MTVFISWLGPARLTGITDIECTMTEVLSGRSVRESVVFIKWIHQTYTYGIHNKSWTYFCDYIMTLVDLKDNLGFSGLRHYQLRKHMILLVLRNNRQIVYLISIAVIFVRSHRFRDTCKIWLWYMRFSARMPKLNWPWRRNYGMELNKSIDVLILGSRGKIFSINTNTNFWSQLAFCSHINQNVWFTSWLSFHERV